MESLGEVSDELRRELRVAVRHSPVAAMLFEEAPVTFCYAASSTETLWDVSIATVGGFRRAGLAAMCVSYMVGVMGAEGAGSGVGSRATQRRLSGVCGQAGLLAGRRDRRIPPLACRMSLEGPAAARVPWLPLRVIGLFVIHVVVSPRG